MRTVALLAAIVLSACGLGVAIWTYSSSAGTALPPLASGQQRSATTTTTTTTTTTSEPLPPTPQPSAYQAADALVSDWARGDRAAALGVATEAAVATLFAIAYPPGDAINRGCATAFPPATCTIGPPGGANPNLPIYSFTMADVPGGWYVSAVQAEGS